MRSCAAAVADDRQFGRNGALSEYGVQLSGRRGAGWPLAYPRVFEMFPSGEDGSGLSQGWITECGDSASCYPGFRSIKTPGLNRETSRFPGREAVQVSIVDKESG